MHFRIYIAVGVVVALALGCASVPEPSKVCMDVTDGVDATSADQISLAVLVAQRGPGDDDAQCHDASAWVHPLPGSVGDLLTRQIAGRGFKIAPAIAVPDGSAADVIHRPHDCGKDLAPYFQACAADVLLVGEAIVSMIAPDTDSCRGEVSLAAYRRTDGKRLFTVYSYVDGGAAAGSCGDVVARLSREAADEVLGQFFVDEQDRG